MQTTATVQQLNDALQHVNDKFDGNICFKREPHQISAKRAGFTLTVIDSAASGGRIGNSGQRVAAACWHVHGEFFEYLFNQGVTLIIAGDKRMESHDDNWQDWNIGSNAQPMYYSEACSC